MTTQFPNCPIQTLIPHCGPHTLLPQCLPQTSPVICHQITIPPQCIPHTSPIVCHLTQPPQCLPQTSPIICHVTQPPQCFPQTLVGPICQHVTSPVICNIVTHNNPLCGIQCQANTRVQPTITFDTTIIQTQTPVFNGGVAVGGGAVGGGGLAAPAQAQNFAGAAAPAPQFAAQANVGPTGVQHCTAAPQFCGNTAWQPCPPVIGPTGVQHCTAGPQFCGNTAWQGCQPQQAQQAQFPIHPTTNPTANTHCFICPPFTIEAQQAAPQQAQAMNPTAATHCFVCPPHTLEAQQQPQQQVGPTGVHFCTAAPQFCGHTAWHGCQPPLSAPPHCPTVAAAVCHTAATVCTQTIAPTHMLGCTCLPMTVGPVHPTNHMQICGNTCLPMTIGPVIPTHNMPICGNVTAPGFC